MKIRNSKLEIRNNVKISITVLVIGLILVLAPLTTAAFAQVKAQTDEQKALTRGEAVMLISATDFMKKKIGELVSWTIGYDISKVNRVKLTPSINYVKAVPRRVPPDGRTILEIEASVDDPGGLGNIAGVLAKTTLDIKKNPTIIRAEFTPDKVRADGKSVTVLTVQVDNPGRVEDVKSVTADLRAFGHAELVALRNDGKEGDAVAQDDVFTLQFVVADFVKTGDHQIRIGAANLIGGYAAEDFVLKVYK
jgi:hypothetical protein